MVVYIVVGYNFTSAQASVPVSRDNYSVAPTAMPVSSHYMPYSSGQIPQNIGSPYYPSGMPGVSHGWSSYGVPPPFQQPISPWFAPPWSYPAMQPQVPHSGPSAPMGQDWHRVNNVSEIQGMNPSVEQSQRQNQEYGSWVRPELAHNVPDKPAKQKQHATYDGKSSFRDYIAHFELISQLNNWLEHRKALELATSLRGQALSVFTDLDTGDRQNYSKLVRALTDKFEPENQHELFRAQMKSKVRKPNEELTKLAQDIRRMTCKAYPTASQDVRETLAKNCFVDALQDHNLEVFIFQAKPVSLDEALKAALEYEAFSLSRAKRMNKAHHVRAQEGNQSRSVTKQEIIVSKDSGRGLSQFKTSQKLSSQKCHYCGKTGHFIAKCNERIRDQKKAIGSKMAPEARQLSPAGEANRSEN